MVDTFSILICHLLIVFVVIRALALHFAKSPPAAEPGPPSAGQGPGRESRLQPGPKAGRR
jgi:hypothetical protein